MSLTWKQLVDDRRLKPHLTSYRELYDLRELIDRDMKDGAIMELSTDRQFATGYNAVLQLGKMVLACVGYRAAGPGHHQTTFDTLELAMGPAVADRPTSRLNGQISMRSRADTSSGWSRPSEILPF